MIQKKEKASTSIDILKDGKKDRHGKCEMNSHSILRSFTPDGEEQEEEQEAKRLHDLV